MRKIRELLRLKFDLGLSIHKIAASLSIARSTVTECLRRAQAAGLAWPLPPELDDAELEAWAGRQDDVVDCSTVTGLAKNKGSSLPSRGYVAVTLSAPSTSQGGCALRFTLDLGATVHFEQIGVDAGVVGEAWPKMFDVLARVLGDVRPGDARTITLDPGSSH